MIPLRAMGMLKPVAFWSALLTGMAITIYGLCRIPWTGADPHHLILIAVASAALIIGAAITRRSPLAIGALAIGALAVGTGSVWPLLVVSWLALSCFALGGAVTRALGGTNQGPAVSLALGAGLHATVIGLIAHLPINYPGVYAVLLTLPILYAGRALRPLAAGVRGIFATRDNPLDGMGCGWLEAPLVVIAALSFLIALLPEVGSDALAMHLFVPAQLASGHQWSFEFTTYVWAVMPMDGDWLYAIGYMLGGEAATRLINMGALLVTALLIRELVLWAGGTLGGARWAMLLFVASPLTFTEGASLFIESVWTAFTTAAVLVALRAHPGEAHPGWRLVLTAILLGFSVATKTISALLVPLVLIAFIVNARKRPDPRDASFLGLAAIAGACAGGAPYAYAWLVTGNPVFPFCNGFFKSPFFKPTNFESSSLFGHGLGIRTPYEVTFESHLHLESYPGAGGFEWLLLLLPSIAVLAFPQGRKALLLIAVGAAFVALVFAQTAYLRYVFPAWPLLIAGIGVAIAEAASYRAGWAWTATSLLTLGLNLLFWSAGASWTYPIMPWRSLLSQADRDDYIAKRIPIRRAVAFVNALNTQHQPVAFIAPTMGAGLAARALYANWYNDRFLDALAQAKSAEEMLNVFQENEIGLLIFDEEHSKSSLGPAPTALVADLTEDVQSFGTYSVRRLKPGAQYPTELLEEPDFVTAHRWNLPEGECFDPAAHAIRVSVSRPASQAVAIRPGGRYLNQVSVRSVSGRAQYRSQINWLDSSGAFITTTIQVFESGPEWGEESQEVIAPANAATAIVYASGHTESAVEFRRCSLRGTKQRRLP